MTKNDTGLIALIGPDGKARMQREGTYEEARELDRLLDAKGLVVSFTVQFSQPAPAVPKKPVKAVPEDATITIMSALEKLSGDREHTTAQIQQWVLGRTLSGQDFALRAKLDRARDAAYEQLGGKLGGKFVQGRKQGRAYTYKFVSEGN